MVNGEIGFLPGRPGQIAGRPEGDAGRGQADGRLGFLRRRDPGRARTRQRGIGKLGGAVSRQRRCRDQRAAEPCHRPVRPPLPRCPHRGRVRRRPAVTAPVAGRSPIWLSSPGRDGARQLHRMRPVARRCVQELQGPPQGSCRIPMATVAGSSRRLQAKGKPAVPAGFLILSVRPAGVPNIPAAALSALRERTCSGSPG